MRKVETSARSIDDRALAVMQAAGMKTHRTKINLTSLAHENDTRGLQLLPKIGQRAIGSQLSSAFGLENSNQIVKKKPLRYLSRDAGDDRAITLTVSNPMGTDVE